LPETPPKSLLAGGFRLRSTPPTPRSTPFAPKRGRKIFRADAVSGFEAVVNAYFFG
jgi:hypothetical protein